MVAEQIDTKRRRTLMGAIALTVTPLISACQTTVNTSHYGTGSASRLPQTQSVLDAYVADGRLPGLCVGVKLPDGDNAFLQAGTLDFGSSSRVDRHSLFRIYSMTKLITGAAAALLIEDGRLSLDQPVADFIPEFANLSVAIDPAQGLASVPVRNGMTVRHLLTHSSGLGYAHTGTTAVQAAYAAQGIFMATSAQGQSLPASYDELVQRLASIPLLFEPGARYEYGMSIDVLAIVIQRASGQPFEQFVQQRILAPLSMPDTVWRLRAADAGRLAALYNYGSDGRGPPVAVPGTSAQDLSRPIAFPFAGSGLLSSAADYLNFLGMLLNDGASLNQRIMQPRTAQLMRSDILPAQLTANGGGHGFGGWVARSGHKRAGEFGWSGNASTQAWIDPANRFATVLMMQALPYRSIDVLTPLRAAIDADLGITR